MKMKITFFRYLINEDLNISIFLSQECIVGRGLNSIGHEFLNYASISREHIKVKIINKYCIEVEDMSKFGTYINGKKMIKGISEELLVGDTITLFDVELELVRK